MKKNNTKQGSRGGAESAKNTTAEPCRFDTDGDGYCPIHPNGCPKCESKMTPVDAALELIDLYENQSQATAERAVAAFNILGLSFDKDSEPSGVIALTLAAEVRRLREENAMIHAQKLRTIDGNFLGEIMQDVWNDFCADTGCCPDFIEISHKRATVSAQLKGSRFASDVADWYNARLAAAESGVKS